MLKIEKRSMGKLSLALCISTIVPIIVIILVELIWYDTERSSSEEYFMDIILIILLLAMFVIWFIIGSMIVISLIKNITKKEKFRISLSDSQPIDPVYYKTYTTFILIIIGISIGSLVIENNLILSPFLFTLCGLLGLIFIGINIKKLINWIKERDIIGFSSIILMITSIWVSEDISSIFWLFAKIGLYLWLGWLIYDIIKKKEERKNLVGLLGIIIEIMGWILDMVYFQITFTIINYLGLFIWAGGFEIDILKRKEVKVDSKKLNNLK